MLFTNKQWMVVGLIGFIAVLALYFSLAARPVNLSTTPPTPMAPLTGDTKVPVPPAPPAPAAASTSSAAVSVPVPPPVPTHK